MPRSIVPRGQVVPRQTGGAPGKMPDLQAMLTAASKLRRSAGPEGTEPLLTPREVEQLKRALPSLPAGVAKLVQSLEGKAGGIAQGLFLRAVATRVDRLQSPQTIEILKNFALSMKGLSAEQLQERATVLDLNSGKNSSTFDPLTLSQKRGRVLTAEKDRAGDNDGLVQRFTSTCGPTVVQIMLAEADPVLAFALTGGNRASVSSRDAAARFQLQVLSEFGAVGIPREESALAARLNNALGRSGVSQAEKTALLNHVKNQGPLNAAATRALTAVRALAAGFPSAAELSKLRTAVLPARDSGLSATELNTAVQKYLGALTGATYRAVEFARGGAAKHLASVETALKKGHDVPFGVSEPAHWLLLTAVKATPAGREFLVSDPEGGRTAWVTETALASGAFVDSPFGLSERHEKPFIDSFLLPR